MRWQRTVRATAHLPRQRKRSQQAHGPRKQHTRQSQKQGRHASAPNITCPFALKLVFAANQLAVPTPQRKSDDFDPSALERQDFAPDKTVADCRVFAN
jgi:hypothetical protein